MGQENERKLADVIRDRDPRQHDERHLAFIRRLPCLVTLTRPAEAAHIRFAALGWGKRAVGMAEKPHDRWTVPLCRAAHISQHAGNEREWWETRGIDPIRAAAALYEATGDDAAGEEIVKRFCKGLKWN